MSRINKDSLPLDKPRRTPDHPTKSHVVKTKVDGQERIIRFGEQGASTAGKPKEGESQAMKDKRASFKARHAKNIAKGKSSPAYWANKVKWADGGLVDPFSRGGQAEMKPTPRSPALGKLADTVRGIQQLAAQYQVKDWVPLLGGMGVDELVGLPGAARETENWSYGNAPLRVNPYAGRTASFVPEIKPGRKSDLFDTALLGADVVAPAATLAAKYGVRGATALGRAGERVAERVVPQVMERGGFGAQALQDLALGSRSQVIKPKGGNWLAGSVEQAMQPLKPPMPSRATDAYGNEVPNVLANSPMYRENAAVNKWLDTKLSKYIRNEMATPEDPVRALADRGVTHIPEGPQGLERVTEWIPSELEPRRKAAGFPEGGMSQTPAGQGWEQLADLAVTNLPAGERINANVLGEGVALRNLKENPWMGKVPPETMTYGVYPVEVRQELAFDHLVDELKNTIRPDTDLPERLRWRPEDLEKVTVPQAVERVAKINEWRAAQKAEADLLRAMNPATQVFKEYPEQGMRWVELKLPEKVDLPKGYSVVEDAPGYRLKSPEGKLIAYGETPEEAVRGFFGEKSLEDALKYEGDVMGHCVGERLGGYCLDVVEGRSRIFSLRDAKGQPHVTIEVKSGKDKTGLLTAEELPPEELADMKARNVYDPKFMYRYNEQMGRHLPELGPFDNEIVQIKGKANRAPNEEYLPFVQDFVRSQKWSRVGDLSNTGLVQIYPEGGFGRRGSAEYGGVAPGLYTPQELDAAMKKLIGDAPPAEGFAAGGLVGLNAKYAEGGEVKHPAARGLPAPSLLNLQSYSRYVAEGMYPEDDVKRDAARHLLASALAAQKTSPRVAEALGRAYEWTEAPTRTTAHWLGLGQPRADYATDVHNNALGAQLGQRARSVDDLLTLVERYVERGTPERRSGAVALVPDSAVGYAEGGAVTVAAPEAPGGMMDMGYDWERINRDAEAQQLPVYSFIARNWDKIIGGLYNKRVAVPQAPAAVPSTGSGLPGSTTGSSFTGMPSGDGGSFEGAPAGSGGPAPNVSNLGAGLVSFGNTPGLSLAAPMTSLAAKGIGAALQTIANPDPMSHSRGFVANFMGQQAPAPVVDAVPISVSSMGIGSSDGGGFGFGGVNASDTGNLGFGGGSLGGFASEGGGSSSADSGPSEGADGSPGGGYARGGAVRTYNPALIDAILQNVETPGFAVGGAVRAYNPAVVDSLVNSILEGAHA